MASLKNYKAHTSTGSAILAGLLRFIAALGRRLEAGPQNRQHPSQPGVNALCYRGLRMTPPATYRGVSYQAPSQHVNPALCYRGARASLPVSTGFAAPESDNQPVDGTLCYRGTPYSKQHLASMSTSA